jgi:hypothetical protein
MGLFGRGPHKRAEPAAPPSAPSADDLRVIRRDAGVRPDLPLEAVARRMLASEVHSVVVFDASGAIGQVTCRELAQALSMGVDPGMTTAADVMVEVHPAGDTFWAPPG